MRIFFKVIKYLLIILALLTLAVFVFVNTSPQFGASPDKNSKKIIEKSKNFVNDKFVNLNPVTVSTDGANIPSEKSATLMD